MPLKNALTATLQREPTRLVCRHFYLYVSGEQIIVVEFVPAKQVLFTHRTYLPATRPVAGILTRSGLSLLASADTVV